MKNVNCYSKKESPSLYIRKESKANECIVSRAEKWDHRVTRETNHEEE